MITFRPRTSSAVSNCRHRFRLASAVIDPSRGSIQSGTADMPRSLRLDGIAYFGQELGSHPQLGSRQGDALLSQGLRLGHSQARGIFEVFHIRGQPRIRIHGLCLIHHVNEELQLFQWIVPLLPA